MPGLGAQARASFQTHVAASVVLLGTMWHAVPWKQPRASGEGWFTPPHDYLTPRPRLFATAWMNAGGPPSAPEIKSKDAPKQKEDTPLLQSLLWMLASHHYANTVSGPKLVSPNPASKALAQSASCWPPPTPPTPHPHPS